MDQDSGPKGDFSFLPQQMGIVLLSPFPGQRPLEHLQWRAKEGQLCSRTTVGSCPGGPSGTPDVGLTGSTK